MHGLPPDIMHDVLEGVLQLEMKCLLDQLLYKDQLFRLVTLNSRISNFPFGNDINDPPKPIPHSYFTQGTKKCQVI